MRLSVWLVLDFLCFIFRRFFYFFFVFSSFRRGENEERVKERSGGVVGRKYVCHHLCAWRACVGLVGYWFCSRFQLGTVTDKKDPTV